MNIAIIALKAAMLVVAALIAFWAAAAIGGVEAPIAGGDDCAASHLRACFFTIV